MKSAVYLLIILTIFTSLREGVAQVAFALATNYSVGTTPYSVTAADVNGDGKVDLICAIEGSNKLLVLTNNGSGIFGSNASYAVFSSPKSVVAADVNGDGKVDLICNYSGGLAVLTNNGNGSFVSAGSYVIGGNIYGWFMAADVNADGKVDLICPGVGNPLMVLTNAGNGIFAAASSLPPAPGGSWFAVTADVNGDGKADLIDVDGAIPFIYMRVLTNAGNGTFALCSSNTLATRWPGIGTKVDINRDGHAALVVPDYDSGSGSSLTVYTNDGTGFFGSNATYVVDRGPLCVIAVDVQGDGRMDLISANLSTSSGTLTVLTNNGNGGFGSNSTLNVDHFPISIVAADVDGNGKMDLITANESGNTISVLINSSIFPPPGSAPVLAINPSPFGLSVSWPSASAGWSLQQTPDLTTTNWSPSGYIGYGISDDGTNKSLLISPPVRNLFFRLLHP